MSLRNQGFLLAGLPLVAVIFSASLAFLGNRQRARTETALTHHIALTEDLTQLSTLMLNAETGVRGYLLARQSEFLQPYELAKQSLSDELTRLHTLVESEPGEEPRVEKRGRLVAIRATVEQEMMLLNALLVHVRDIGTDPAPPNEESLKSGLARSRVTMETLRNQLREMRGEETKLLSERLSDIEHVRRRDYLVIAATLLLGLVTRGAAFHFFNRRVVGRVAALTENVRALRQNAPAPHPPSNTRDAIGELEQELARGLPLVRQKAGE